MSPRRRSDGITTIDLVGGKNLQTQEGHDEVLAKIAEAREHNQMAELTNPSGLRVSFNPHHVVYVTSPDAPSDV
ncbi:MAG: hypothetical protein ACR2NA_07700 [Solirubrobacterales bacterium]